jgi:hypothetical protein
MIGKILALLGITRRPQVQPNKPTLIEREINDLYQQTLRGENRGKRIGIIRRGLAYSLKIVAGGASVVVAINRWPEYHQACGAASIVAIFLDSVFSNHKRMIAEVSAGYAFFFLRERIQREYNRDLDPLIKLINNNSADSQIKTCAFKDIDTLQRRAHKELSDGIVEIKQRLADADIKALDALALDNERAAKP